MQIRKLTLKEFIDSKNQLLEAIKYDPLIIMEYYCIKYTKIHLINEQGNEIIVDIKPKTTFKVLWRYQLVESQQEYVEENITRQCVEVMIDDLQLNTSKTPAQMERWIKTNTIHRK